VKKWFFLLITVIMGLLQVSVLDYFKLFGVKPDLLLICMVLASLYFELKWALCLSIFAGILKDIFSANIFGINILLFPLWSFIIIKLSKNIPVDNNVIRTLLIFLVVILNNIFIRAIFLFLGKPISWGVSLRVASLESLYTALVVPLAFKIIKPFIYS